MAITKECTHSLIILQFCGIKILIHSGQVTLDSVVGKGALLCLKS